MVNVNKNIKSGSKVRPTAPKRRPRNHALNSSRKSLPDSILNRRLQKLNCSRESVINQLVNEEQIYTREEAEELIDDFEDQTGATVVRLATMDEVENEDGEFWATKDGKTTLWCRGNGFWYDSGSTDMNSSKKTRMNCSSIDSHSLDPIYDTLYNSATAEEYAKYFEVPVEDVNELAQVVRDNGYGDVVGYLTAKPEYSDALSFNAIDGAMVLEDGTVGILVRDRFHEIVTDIELLIDNGRLPKNLDSSRNPAQRTRMNCSADTKITTESGNEISMGEIKVVQNPSTNELALYIPENDDDAIPEGFVVIGDVVGTGEESEPAADEGEEPKLDSSKKKTKINCSSDADAQAAREVLIKHAMSDGSSREDAMEDIDDFEKQNKASVVGLPTDEEKSRYGDGIWMEDWEGGRRRYFALVDGGYYEEVDLNSSNDDPGGKVGNKDNTSCTRK